METKLFNFNLPVELKDYLNQASEHSFTNVSQYIINLIAEDKKIKQARLSTQVLISNPLTNEILEKTSRTYESGRKKKIGDYVVFGLLELDENNAKLIQFHPDELGTTYKLSDRDKPNNKLPFLIKK